MTQPLISIVIPTRNSARTLEACLKSIRSEVYPDYEIIIVDAASNDDTPGIAGRLADRVISRDATVTESRNIGFKEARGGILLSIDSDMVLEPGLLRDIASRMSGMGGMSGMGALIIPELGRGKSFLSKLKSLEKKCYLNDPQMESARVFSKEAFAAVKGYDERLKFGEDWDIHCRIRAAFPIGRAEKCVYHDTDGLTIAGDVRKFYGYGRSARSFTSKKNPGSSKIVSPSRFLFIGHWAMLASTPLESAMLVILKGLESAAFGLGYLTSFLSR
jgi:glycosyltransferase involved in cell wall biosynthesis